MGWPCCDCLNPSPDNEWIPWRVYGGVTTGRGTFALRACPGGSTFVALHEYAVRLRGAAARIGQICRPNGGPGYLPRRRAPMLIAAVFAVSSFATFILPMTPLGEYLFLAGYGPFGVLNGPGLRHPIVATGIALLISIAALCWHFARARRSLRGWHEPIAFIRSHLSMGLGSETNQQA
jgi:hypothetical protein